MGDLHCLAAMASSKRRRRWRGVELGRDLLKPGKKRRLRTAATEAPGPVTTKGQDIADFMARVRAEDADLDALAAELAQKPPLILALAARAGIEATGEPIRDAGRVVRGLAAARPGAGRGSPRPG